MLKSTHRCEIIPLSLRTHPNADSLSIVDVFDGGYTCVVRTEDWLGHSQACWIPPDSLVNTDKPIFAFLRKDGSNNMVRIKACKLRGVTSYGLLVPAPPNMSVGDDAADYYGVQHYEPEIKGESTYGEATKVHPHLSGLSKYDVDSLRRYKNVFIDGEQVYISEKLHGASARFCYIDGCMFCGSRTEWKREDPNNLWWKALAATPELRKYCEKHPGWIVYGEVYGNVQDLKYGCGKGDVRFAAFDLLSPARKWIDAQAFRLEMEEWCVPLVPLIGYYQYDFNEICKLAEGKTLVKGANHVREGCVVKPLVERWHDCVGRVCLKIVGSGYLEKSK